MGCVDINQQALIYVHLTNVPTQTLATTLAFPSMQHTLQLVEEASQVNRKWKVNTTNFQPITRRKRYTPPPPTATTR